MNRLQRFLISLTSKFVPQLRNVMRSAGGTIDALQEKVDYLQARTDDRQELARREAADVREAIQFTRGSWVGGIRESSTANEYDGTAVVGLKERLAELELALEDRGWKREQALSQWEFSRYGLQQLIAMCRLYFVKNPLIRRGINVSADYVFGRGFEVRTDNEAANAVIQEFREDPSNAAEIGQVGIVAKEESLHTDGNVFFVLFSDPATGKVSIRTIDALEVQEIIADPDDASQPQYYKRAWTQAIYDLESGRPKALHQEAWYPALDYNPPARPANIGGKSIKWDSPVLHLKTGGSPKWQFGAPMVYSAIDWARAYKHLLEDWCTTIRALARFAWGVETKGGPQAIAGLKQALITTMGSDGNNIETNPPATTGATWISGGGNKIEPMRTAGATTNPEQGRRVLLMVAAALGLPETFFGDASTGSLATAQSLDRPTELKFLRRQEYWRFYITRIVDYVLDQSSTAVSGRMREALKDTPKAKITITVDFPAVLEHDINTRVSAIVNAMTLNGFETTGIDQKVGVGLLLGELGVEKIQVVLEAMFPQADYEPNRLLEPEEPAVVPGTDPTPGNGAPPVPPKPRTAHPKRVAPPTGRESMSREQVMTAAVIELQKAFIKLQERGLVGTSNGH